MTVRELVIHEVESLDEQELEYVARFTGDAIEASRYAPGRVYVALDGQVRWDPAVYGPLYREFAARTTNSPKIL